VLQYQWWRLVVIVSAVRPATGTYNGRLAEVPAMKCGELCNRSALAQADFKPDQVEEVIMDNVCRWPWAESGLSGGGQYWVAR